MLKEKGPDKPILNFSLVDITVIVEEQSEVPDLLEPALL